jgi:hypothetical protein
VAGWLGGWLAGNEVKIMLAKLKLSLAKTMLRINRPENVIQNMVNANL